MTAQGSHALDSGFRDASTGFLARACAICGYLAAGCISFLPPLTIYLLVRRNSGFLRTHLAQAANAAITTALYALCAAIIGGLLALDSVYLGLRVALTGAMFAWLVTLGYLTAAAIAAGRGRFYPIPACLCAALLKPKTAAQDR